MEGYTMAYADYVAIVDDDGSMRVSLARLLRIHGFESRTYPSASAFLSALPGAIPFCLIVDVNMPDMTGLDLQRELRKLGAQIPTIVITGVEDKNVVAKAKSLGADAFLYKPFTQAEIIAALNGIAKKKN